MIIPDEIPGEEYARMSIQELTQLMQEQNLSLADIVDDLTHLHFDLPDVSFDHWDMHWTSPHPGINVPHYDVHFYLISEEEKENICPTSTAQDIYTAEILQQLVELNVPGVAAPPTEQ